MIRCEFPDGAKATLRHVTTDVIGLRDEHVLLVRRADHLVEGGKWALPGGYMDRDESLVECAVREFLEETGYACSAIRLFNVDSRPQRPGNERQNVTGVFLADVGAQVGEPDDESTDMRWFSLEEISRRDDIAFGHEQYTNAVARYLHAPFTLPLLDGAALSDL